MHDSFEAENDEQGMSFGNGDDEQVEDGVEHSEDPPLTYSQGGECQGQEHGQLGAVNQDLQEDLAQVQIEDDPYEDQEEDDPVVSNVSGVGEDDGGFLDPSFAEAAQVEDGVEYSEDPPQFYSQDGECQGQEHGQIGAVNQDLPEDLAQVHIEDDPYEDQEEEDPVVSKVSGAGEDDGGFLDPSFAEAAEAAEKEADEALQAAQAEAEAIEKLKQELHAVWVEQYTNLGDESLTRRFPWLH